MCLWLRRCGESVFMAEEVRGLEWVRWFWTGDGGMSGGGTLYDQKYLDTPWSGTVFRGFS